AERSGAEAACPTGQARVPRLSVQRPRGALPLRRRDALGGGAPADAPGDRPTRTRVRRPRPPRLVAAAVGASRLRRRARGPAVGVLGLREAPPQRVAWGQSLN